MFFNKNLILSLLLLLSTQSYALTISNLTDSSQYRLIQIKSEGGFFIEFETGKYSELGDNFVPIVMERSEDKVRVNVGHMYCQSSGTTCHWTFLVKDWVEVNPDNCTLVITENNDNSIKASAPCNAP